jgi:hypothetical protein
MNRNYNQGNPAANSFNYGQQRAQTAGPSGPYGGGLGGTRNYAGSEMGDSDTHS